MWTGYTGILGVLVLIADVWALVNILQGGGDTGTKVVWIVVILLLPVLGFLIWYFMGSRSGRA